MMPQILSIVSKTVVFHLGFMGEAQRFFLTVHNIALYYLRILTLHHIVLISNCGLMSNGFKRTQAV